jgi:hypothetical protein
VVEKFRGEDLEFGSADRKPEGIREQSLVVEERNRIGRSWSRLEKKIAGALSPLG